MKPLIPRLLRLASMASVCSSLLPMGCAKQPARVAWKGPAQQRSSDKSGRESVAVTVYNQNFAVVRETRKLGLRLGRGSGLVELSFKDVAAHIQPETVRIHSLHRRSLFNVLEQNYRYDLLTPAKLLEKHVGKRVYVYRYHDKTGVEEKKEAQVLSVEGGVTLRIDGEVTTGFQGRFAFKELPQSLLDKPTLVWLLETDQPEQRVEVTYLTQNVGWRADYVLKLGPTDERADLNGWVTLNNQSGTSYENAALRLVAGDVNRLQPPMPEASQTTSYREDVPQAPPQFKQENLFEYHLYSLQRPTSILDKETKQVSLLQADGLDVKKRLIFQGAHYYYREKHGQLATSQKLGVFLEIQNSAKNRLGIPLPKGILRVYKADTSGALQFIGEDAIDHIPRDEKLEVKLGEAFDVVGDRVQKEWLAVAKCTTESTYEVEIRNHKDIPEQVQIVEPAGLGFEVLQSSHPVVKVDSATFRFDVQVPARGKLKVSYRARVVYC